ncbi:MAG: DNA-binding protein WhiA [Chloroflexota bacterium]
MSRAERDLVTALRDELAAVAPSRSCDRVAEVAGLGPGTLGREVSVARLAVRLRRSGERGASVAAPFDWGSAADHCRAAWLRGRFLARGSLSLAGGRTHLEFVVDPTEAPVLVARLADIGLPASSRVRRGRGVVTSKSGEAVGTFFRRLGAAGTLLEIEARQVSRALRGELNRVLNAESANLQRAVSAAGRQLDAIAILEADGRLAIQPPAVRQVAEARRATPEASLADLAERLGAHRSAVQRALERLERLASDNDEGMPLRGRPTRRFVPRPPRSPRPGRPALA